MHQVTPSGRSREGAWIEIIGGFAARLIDYVAPVRERGLKFKMLCVKDMALSRSREGAWIEIMAGAMSGGIAGVAPVRERGLK